MLVSVALWVAFAALLLRYGVPWFIAWPIGFLSAISFLVIVNLAALFLRLI